MERQHAWVYASCALMMALGISVGGYFIGNTLYKSRIATNIATVKGLAEREVKANIAVWTINFSAAGPDLKSVYATANGDTDKVIAFLKKAGFDDTTITKNALTVNTQDNRDNNGVVLSTSYNAYGSVNIRSDDVDKVATAAQQVGDLVGEGVMLNNSQPEYIFTKLNDIKPEMLGEATRNARIAAEQFAKDANAKVGSINSAEQGAFNFSARDASDNGMPDTASIYKKVRVVTTISFYLNN